MKNSIMSLLIKLIIFSTFVTSGPISQWKKALHFIYWVDFIKLEGTIKAHHPPYIYEYVNKTFIYCSDADVICMSLYYNNLSMTNRYRYLSQ